MSVPRPDSDLWAKAEKIWARVDRWRKNDGIKPREDAELMERGAVEEWGPDERAW